MGPTACCSKTNQPARLGEFALSQMPATGEWEGWQTSVQRPTPPPPPLRIGNQRAGAFIARSGEGATCRNSTVSSDSHLQIGHQGSAQHYVGYLGTVILQFQGPLVPIFCSQFSELWQLMS